MAKSPENIVENIIDVVNAGGQVAANIAASSSMTERELYVGALQHQVEEVGLIVTDTFISGPDTKDEEPWKTGMTRSDIFVIRSLSKGVRREMLIGIYRQRRAAKSFKEIL